MQIQTFTKFYKNYFFKFYCIKIFGLMLNLSSPKALIYYLYSFHFKMLFLIEQSLAFGTKQMAHKNVKSSGKCNFNFCELFTRIFFVW